MQKHALTAMSSILIDGSVLEGGGQLVRNAVALAALLQRPITIEHIRPHRAPPGLKAQHAAGLRLVAQICSADMTGCELGADSVSFRPGALRGGSFLADPGTAGSTALLLQVACPPLVFALPAAARGDGARESENELVVRGGTNAARAPQADYTQHVLLPFLRAHFALAPRLTVRRRGYYPKGGGELRLCIPPTRGPLPAVTLTERGAVVGVKGRAYVAGYPERMAKEIRAAAVARLVAGGVEPDIIDVVAVREKATDAFGRGSGAVLWAETENGCRLGGGSTGLRGEDLASLGNAAADELLRNIEHGGCVDEYLQDQMIIFLALAEGRSTVRTGPLTLHTKTAMYIAEQLTDAKFSVQEDTGRTLLLSCEGIGFSV